MEIIKRDDISKGLLIMKDGNIQCFGGIYKEQKRATKEEKQKSDEAIALIWKLKKAEWTQQDIAKIFGKHIDTIFAILKKSRETALFTGNKNIKK